MPTRKKRVTPNPVVDSLHIVYNPAPSSSSSNIGDDDEGESESATSKDNTNTATRLRLVDPSGVVLEFQSVADFEVEEQLTR